MTNPSHDELIKLLEHIYDRLEGMEDVANSEDGKQRPNLAMSIRMDIESVLRAKEK